MAGYSSSNGLWLKLPYFHIIDDHADMTLTPGYSTEGDLSFGIEQRRLFQRGRIVTSGELVWDQDHDEELRGHVQLQGDWDIGDGFKLDFSGEAVSDPEFPEDFGAIPDSTLTSFVRVTRRTAASWFEAGTKHVDQLDDNSGTRPSLIHDTRYRMVSSPLPGAGTIGLELGAHSLRRGAVSGNSARDVTRGSMDVEWTNRWFLDGGMVVSAAALGRFTSYSIKQDDQFTNSLSTMSETAALELALPLLARLDSGAHLVEPFAQLVWSPAPDCSLPPNEDSVFVEFDDTSIRSLDRFAGRDRSEAGSRLNLGVKHTSIFPDGTGLELTFGRVFRDKDRMQFSPESGFAGKNSAMIAAGSLEFPGGLTVDQRVVFGSGSSMTKSESFLQLDTGESEVRAGYSRLLKDESEQMTNDVKSLVLFAERNLDNHWAVNTSLEHDFNKEGENVAGVGLTFRHQCLQVVFNAERYSETVSQPKAKNKFKLNLMLAGFTDPDAVASAGCSA